jgi:hypothetical protein
LDFKHYTEFSCVVIGCAVLSLLSIFESVDAARKDNTFQGYFAMVSLLLSIADCSFLMSNSFASYRLLMLSFRLSAGFRKTLQQLFKRIFLFTALSCSTLALASVVGYTITLANTAVEASDSCFFKDEVLRRTCPWGFVQYSDGCLGAVL